MIKIIFEQISLFDRGNIEYQLFKPEPCNRFSDLLQSIRLQLFTKGRNAPIGVSLFLSK